MDRRIVAAAELVLIFPAALFLTAVVARHLQPLEEVTQDQSNKNSTSVFLAQL